MTLESAPPVVELRQYLLHRGRRDELIALFDREFVETQEAVGIRVLGQFRDVDRVNHFVWLRGFADHDTRREALTSFYGGAVWRQHAAAANGTMIDSGDVHQLRPASEPEQLRVRKTGDRDLAGNRGSLLIVVAHRRSGDSAEHDRLVRAHLAPRLEAAGLRTIGVLTTDPADNAFPALPVRPSDVLVWIAAGSNLNALDRAAEEVALARAELADHTRNAGLGELLLDVLRLEPTARSCLNGADV
jgi:NIPSNAP